MDSYNDRPNLYPFTPEQMIAASYLQSKERFYNDLKGEKTEFLERRLSEIRPKGVLDSLHFYFFDLKRYAEHSAISRILEERKSSGSASIDDKL